MRLTDDEQRQLADGTALRMEGALVRPPQVWMEILRDLAPEDAAARILGDIFCFQPDRGLKRRNGALGDVLQLANALRGFAAVTKWAGR